MDHKAFIEELAKEAKKGITTKIKELEVRCTPDSDQYEDCKECIYFSNDDSECINKRCIHSLALYDCFEKKKPKSSTMTNLEKIRQMDKEQICKFFHSRGCDVCAFTNECTGKCRDGFFQWLDEEAKDD